MATNNDGLEIGQPVDFETLMRIKAEQRRKKDGDSEPAKQRGRKKEVRRSGKQQDEDSSESIASEEA